MESPGHFPAGRESEERANTMISFSGDIASLAGVYHCLNSSRSQSPGEPKECSPVGSAPKDQKGSGMLLDQRGANRKHQDHPLFYAIGMFSSSYKKGVECVFGRHLE